LAARAITDGKRQAAHVHDWLLAVPQRVLGADGTRAFAQRGEQEHLVERVRGGVGGLRERGAGAHQEPGDELDGADEEVRGARDEPGAPGGRLFRHAALPPRAVTFWISRGFLPVRSRANILTGRREAPAPGGGRRTGLPCWMPGMLRRGGLARVNAGSRGLWLGRFAQVSEGDEKLRSDDCYG